MCKKLVIALIFLLVGTKIEAQNLVFTTVDSLLTAGNYNQAIHLLNTKKVGLGKNEKLGNIYAEIGNCNKAIVFYNKAIKENSSNRLIHKLAKTLKQAGFINKSIEKYYFLYRKDSSNLLVANNLAKLLLQQKKFKKALQVYDFLEKTDSLNPYYSYQKGRILKKQNQLYPSGQNFLNAYKKDTLHLKTIYELAKFYKKIKFKDSSNLFVNKGLQLAKNSISFNMLKASQLYYKKDFVNGLKYMKRLDSLNARSVYLYELMGMSFYNLNKLDSAKAYFEKAKEIDFRNPKIRYRLASVAYAKKQYVAAEKDLLISIAFSKPDLDKQYVLLGLIFIDKKKPKKAIEQFKKAYANNLRNHKALFILATACEKHYKDKKIAYNYFKKYVANFPEINKEKTAYAKKSIELIKKQYFIEGEKLE